MRLLFTGGGGAATEALWKLLSPQHEVYFGDADFQSKPACIPSDHWVTVWRADEPEFVLMLSALCHSMEIDVLVPGVDEELTRILYARGSFACDVLTPDLEFVETHLDKFVSMIRLASAVSVPTTAQYEGIVHDVPCVVKPRRGRGSRGVRIVHDYVEAPVVFSEPMVIQELLIGQEYTCTLVADRTKTLRAVVPVKVEKKRGVTLRGATDHDDAVTALCQQIHKAHPFSGIVNVQCIKQADGTVKPFEINPRISTTTCLAIAAGVDVIGLALSDGLAPFKTVTLRRSWQNEFV